MGRLRKEVVPPGTIPFDGISIDANDQNTEDYIRDLEDAYDKGTLSKKDARQRLDVLEQEGKVFRDTLTNKPRKSKPKPRAPKLEGLEIQCRTPEIEQRLKEMKRRFEDGQIREADLERELDSLMQQGEIRVSKNSQYPYRAPRINSKKPDNPLSGKGKSYGKHVEDGWGQYVKPDLNPDLDGDDLDGLWR